ncbi:hypothetical protein BD626DRAFT_490712 [Schizophyllum amplum]|uniref:CS domain-containing protein n=1 Tax=Schizophyllum amplum TaxID=97359 RepID=A0A550CJR8_9AGAR|nr:hypothetical protein BD626DRAFT_490712 [Auriculariopsis ampla]
MEMLDEQRLAYSWHQSHDQATILLMVPNSAREEDVVVTIEGQYLVAGIKGREPIIKGKLYSEVDPSTSTWQLETNSRPGRGRTTSSTSSASTPSSYAFVSDPDISSSFAASLDSGPVSETEEAGTSPLPGSGSEVVDHHGLSIRLSRARSTRSGPASPAYYSSLESLESRISDRLLTLHLDKAQSIIWPSLVVGPVPPTLSPLVTHGVVYDASDELEHQYNMDPTSLILIGLDLYDIRKQKREAFEFLVRAWHQNHGAAATIRLATNYVPVQASFDIDFDAPASRDTEAYYAQCLGGADGLAQLYLDAGLLHLEGAASSLVSPSFSSLSSLRVPPPKAPLAMGGAHAWRRDREAAGSYFERARVLRPDLDVPVLSPIAEPEQFQMPSFEMLNEKDRQKEEAALVKKKLAAPEDMDDAWYLYVPTIIGAGTAILMVGVVGALTMSTWSRRHHGS